MCVCVHARECRWGEGQERLPRRGGVQGEINLEEVQETSRLREQVKWWELKKKKKNFNYSH